MHDQPLPDHGYMALGRCYEKGLGGPKDPDRACWRYSQVAEKGDSKAQLLAGMLERDAQKRLHWLREATEQGHRYAQYLQTPTNTSLGFNKTRMRGTCGRPSI